MVEGSVEKTPPEPNGAAPELDSTLKPEQPLKAQSATASSQKETAQDSAQPVLSNAELKKRAKAEKAAKRAREKTVTESATPSGPSHPASLKGKKVEGQQKDQKLPQKDPRPQSGAQERGTPKQQQPAAAAIQLKSLPQRRRLSASGGPVKVTKPIKRKEVALFGHLYGQARRHSLEGSPKDIHPAILALGLQTSSYVVCGSTARCVAMLLAFKSVGKNV